MFEYLPERPLEPPEDKPIAYCDYCGGEIYEGETVYSIDGQLIHEDCLHDFADDYFKDCKEEAVSYRNRGSKGYGQRQCNLPA